MKSIPVRCICELGVFHAIPVTVPKAGYDYWNIWAPDYTKRGGMRIPGTAYHRLDLSVNYYFKTFKLESNLNLSIYNAYNRHNAFAVYFRDKNLDRKAQAVKVALRW